MPLGALENGRVRKPVADAIGAAPQMGGAVLRSPMPGPVAPAPGGAWSPGTGSMPPRPNPSAGTVGPSGRGIGVSSGPMRPPAGRTLPPGATLSPDGNNTGYFAGGRFHNWPAEGEQPMEPFDVNPETGGFDINGAFDNWDVPSYEQGNGNPIQPMDSGGGLVNSGSGPSRGSPLLPGGPQQTPPPPPSITGNRQQITDSNGTQWQWEPNGTGGGRWSQITPVSNGGGTVPGIGGQGGGGYPSPQIVPGSDLPPTVPLGSGPFSPPGGGITPTSGGYPPIIIGPSGGGGTGGGHASRTESTYSYDKPIHTFDPAEAQNYAPALSRENVDGLKFTDLLAREGNNGLPYNEMIAREQAPDQLYGKQQALEAANEANALLAQGLKRRHADIAGQLGSRGMGEGGAAARLGDLATSETLGQQASNIRSALENAAKYGDERSLNIFGQQIGQRGQDVTQQNQLNQAILELLGQGVQQRGQDVSMANEINQGGLALNNQRIAQRGQDVDQQKTVAQIIQSLLGQNQKEMWSNSSGSSSGGGNQGWATEAGLGNIMGRVFNML